MDKINELLDWLQGEKYGYFLEDHKTWVEYGDLNDEGKYDESKKKYELGSNRSIVKTIDKINELFNIKKEVDKMENKIKSITRGKDVTFENGETKILDSIDKFNEFKKIKNNLEYEITTQNLTEEEVEKISHIIYKNDYTTIIDSHIVYNAYDELVDYYQNPDKYFKITHTDVVSEDSRLVFIGKPYINFNRTTNVSIYIYNHIDLDIDEYNRFIKMEGNE